MLAGSRSIMFLSSWYHKGGSSLYALVIFLYGVCYYTFCDTMNCKEFERLGLKCNFALASNKNIDTVFCALKNDLPENFLILKRCSGTECIFMRLLLQTDGFYKPNIYKCAVCESGRLVPYIEDLLYCNQCGRPHKKDRSVFSLIEWSEYTKERERESAKRLEAENKKKYFPGGDIDV